MQTQRMRCVWSQQIRNISHISQLPGHTAATEVTGQANPPGRHLQRQWWPFLELTRSGLTRPSLLPQHASRSSGWEQRGTRSPGRAAWSPSSDRLTTGPGDVDKGSFPIFSWQLVNLSVKLLTQRKTHIRLEHFTAKLAKLAKLPFTRDAYWQLSFTDAKEKSQPSLFCHYLHWFGKVPCPGQPRGRGLLW